MMTSRHETLADILLECAADERNTSDVLTFRRGNSEHERVSGFELLKRTQWAAAALRASGVKAGDRVLLMLTSQSDFVDGFLGAIWADAVPVPLFPPIFSRRPEDFIANFGQIATNSGAKVLLASDETINMLGDFVQQFGPDFRILSRSSWDSSSERLEQAPTRRLGDLALLQYTSGSTGTPKGVALSHENALANMHAIGKAVALNKDDRGVSWLPLYHDMGLIGVLATLYWGGRVALLSPLDFAKDPATWLRAISDYKGTLSPAPNFAYRRCLRLADNELVGLDLSSWRVAFNGSEPVDADTMRTFTKRFEPYGFRSSALYPVYGLAEHTLAVSFPTLGQGPHIDSVHRETLSTTGTAVSVCEQHPDAQHFVSVGVPLEGVLVEIRDEQRKVQHEGHVGEIWVKSASVMTGYFENAAATADALFNGWLRTGDLGYFRDGMMYITGRIKDVIIRAGRNYYPDDIETAAIDVPGVRAGRAAAFTVPAGASKEEVVVLAESELVEDKQRIKLKHAIASAVAARVGFRPERVKLIARGSLPVTSSGKVRRRVARHRFIAEFSSTPSSSSPLHQNRSYATDA